MDTVLDATFSGATQETSEGVSKPVLLKADNIAITYDRLENEIIFFPVSLVSYLMAIVV